MSELLPGLLAYEVVAAIRENPALRDELRALLLEGEDQPSGACSPWLSLDEAAAYLRVSPRTLERRIVKGSVRSTTIGRRRLLHRDDLDELAQTATREETARTAPPRRRRGVE